MSTILTLLRSGFRTGEPKWVIPGAIFLAFGVFYFLNLPFGDGENVHGFVQNCVVSSQRLTGAQSVLCLVQLDDGTVQQYRAYQFLDKGAPIVVRRYPRRLFGYYYED